MKKVIAIFGGDSTESDISVITAIEALNACPFRDYRVYPIFVRGGSWYSSDSMLDLKTFIDFEPKNHKKVALIGNKLYYEKRGKWKFLDDVDCALLLTHGGVGESGELQGFLEISEVPYTSSRVRESALSMDKYLLKLALKDMQIGVVKGVIVENDGEESVNKVEKALDYPVFVKPNAQGSSIGVGRAKNREELLAKLAVAFKYDNRVLVEKCMENFEEYNVAVARFGDNILVSDVEKPFSAGEFLSFEDKYLDYSKTACLCKREFPACISEELRAEIRSISQNVYENLNLKGVVRFDFIYKKRLYLNELNAIPGSLAHYLFPGISYTDFLSMLIDEAIDNGVKKYPAFESGVLKQGGWNYK